NMRGAPLLYAGVGTGILVSAELIGAGNVFAMHSHGLWMTLAAAAGVLSAIAWRIVSGYQARPKPVGAQSAGNEAGDALRPWPLILIYGLAGFGYIVTATYLPLFVRNAVGQVDPIHIWAVFGLGAAPSCFLWHALHVRLGTRRALALNLAVQAAGVVLPVISLSPLFCLASSLLVGGTFVGTVTIAMPAARRLATAVRFNIFATMTASYGVGQIAGPILSDLLYRQAHSFNLPLLAAGGALAVAAGLCLV
ncbi:MAG TPA: YbfB/YjiJ family MFS transporter, partial [Noviherbaspirillum sp.]